MAFGDRHPDRDRDDELRDRERDRNKEREKTSDREKERRERDRKRDKEKDRDKEKERRKTKDEDREKERVKDRDREKERVKDRDREKDKGKVEERDKEKEKERDKGRTEERDRDREKERDRGRDRDRDGFRDREKKEEKERERDREREKNREKGAGKAKDDQDGKKKKERPKDSDRDTDRDRDAHNSKDRRKEKRDREKERDYDKGRGQDRERGNDWDNFHRDAESNRNRPNIEQKDDYKGSEKNRQNEDDAQEERIREKHQEEGVHKKNEGQALTGKGRNEGANEVAAWVSKSRKLEERKKIEERIKAARMARMLEEQEIGDDENSEDEKPDMHSGKDLAGLKVRHGLDKLIEGGAVTFTLKDKVILEGDDLNEEVDELENFEIAQQQARTDAYIAAKKGPGTYEDKFQNDINAIRPVLPQYDVEMKDEGVTLDDLGGISGESQKKLEEIRNKLQGVNNHMEVSLGGQATNIASDYFTQEEMVHFNKPKKRKRLRKREMLDIDALEAEAIAEGLGVEDLGSRSSVRKSATRREEERAAEASRKTAYETAFSKAVDSSRKLREGNAGGQFRVTDEEELVFGGEDDDELYKSLQRAREAALKKQRENGNSGSGAHAVVAALKLPTQTPIQSQVESSDIADKDKAPVVLTDMEEFCRSLQLEEAMTRRPGPKDAFAEEEEEATGMIIEEEPQPADGGWREVKEADDQRPKEKEVTDEAEDLEEPIKESTVGKGLAGALQLLKERGNLKETVQWGGRNMDKKKSKLVGIVGDSEEKAREIQLDRLDEFGRMMTPKEAFRQLSHKFHGKGPGKMKLEKRVKQYREEMKLKQMNSGDTPLMSMEKMRDAQAKMHTPYIVISGHIKPGQTSDPRSGFGTVEKEPIGSLTPMLGDRKVEHFLGIKRKPENRSMGPPPPKKPKTG